MSWSHSLWAAALAGFATVATAQVQVEANRAAGAMPASAPASAPASMPVTVYSQGPMRVEIAALLEQRFRYLDQSMQQTRPPELRFQVRVAGENVTKVARYGQLILDEVVDDTGLPLVDATKLTEAQRTQTRLSSMPPERLAEQGLLLVGEAKAAARAAKTLKTMRGSVKIVYADGFEEVTILNPLQYVGQGIEDSRLKAMGIEISIAKTDQFEPAYEPKKGLALKIKTGDDRIRSIEFFDAWMKNIRARPQPVLSKDETEFAQYRLLGGELDDKSQMVIKVFKNVREDVVKFDFKDVELP